jgi:hypothetical protein
MNNLHFWKQDNNRWYLFNAKTTLTLSLVKNYITSPLHRDSEMRFVHCGIENNR